MIEVLSNENGTIEVGRSGPFGQMIRATRPDGETRTTLMIECREEYDFEMTRSMEWLGLIAPAAGADAPGAETDGREDA